MTIRDDGREFGSKTFNKRWYVFPVESLTVEICNKDNKVKEETPRVSG